MMGAGIPYPYKVPNLTQKDGTPGTWTMIGAAEAVQEEMEAESKAKENQVELDCGSKRDDEK